MPLIPGRAEIMSQWDRDTLLYGAALGLALSPVAASNIVSWRRIPFDQARPGAGSQLEFRALGLVSNSVLLAVAVYAACAVIGVVGGAAYRTLLHPPNGR